MLVVVMDDQGGGMYIDDYSTVSVSQGSYTSCSAEVSRAFFWLVQGPPVFWVSAVISPLAPAAPAVPALTLVSLADHVILL